MKTSSCFSFSFCVCLHVFLWDVTEEPQVIHPLYNFCIRATVLVRVLPDDSLYPIQPNNPITHRRIRHNRTLQGGFEILQKFSCKIDSSVPRDDARKTWTHTCLAHTCTHFNYVNKHWCTHHSSHRPLRSITSPPDSWHPVRKMSETLVKVSLERWSISRLRCV